MKIISTTDISRVGNDCYIYEAISLVEQFGIYAIIRCLKVTGWAKTESIEVIFSSHECSDVIKEYDRLGGIIK